MSMRSLETAIINELREVSGIKKLRVKDMLEWTTGEIKPDVTEQVFFLRNLRINVAVLKSLLPVPKVAKKLKK